MNALTTELHLAPDLEQVFDYVVFCKLVMVMYGHEMQTVPNLFFSIGLLGKLSSLNVLTLRGVHIFRSIMKQNTFNNSNSG